MFIYVIPFYLSPATRPSATLTRDAPSSIRARTRAVTFSSFLCCVLTVVVLYKHDVTATGVSKLLGVWPISPLDVARTMLLVIILFAGPIFEHGFVDGGFQDWIRLRGVRDSLSSWIGYRNFVVVSRLACYCQHPLTVTGTSQRRACLAVFHNSPPCSGSVLRKADCLSNTFVLWHCPPAPPLRIPHHASRSQIIRGGTSISLPVHLHVSIWLFRRLRVHSHW